MNLQYYIQICDAFSCTKWPFNDWIVYYPTLKYCMMVANDLADLFDATIFCVIK